MKGGYVSTRVEHVVLHVPAEGGEQHADVHPGDHDTRHLIIQMAQQAAMVPLMPGQIVQVPGSMGILLLFLSQWLQRLWTYKESQHIW